MHKLLRVFALPLCAGLGLALAGCSHREPTTRSLPEAARLMPTAEASAATDSLASGIFVQARSLEAGQSHPVRAAAMGIVRQVFFEEGQRVRPGQVLVKLDSDWKLPSRQLARGFVVAQSHGTLVGKSVSIGSRVLPGQLLATLQDWSTMRLTLVMPSHLAQGIEPSDTLVVHLRECRQQAFAAIVEQLQVADLPDEPALITLLAQNPKHLPITSGMHATATLPLAADMPLVE